MGVVHIAVSPFGWDGLWSQVVAEGVWNTFTLEPATGGEHFWAEALWTTVGSWGVPMLALGSYVVWSVRRGHRVPGWLGWPLLAWGVLYTVLVPASPAWAFPVMGLLIVLGDRRPRTT